jgi:hypothetical protein
MVGDEGLSRHTGEPHDPARGSFVRMTTCDSRYANLLHPPKSARDAGLGKVLRAVARYGAECLSPSRQRRAKLAARPILPATHRPAKSCCPYPLVLADDARTTLGSGALDPSPSLLAYHQRCAPAPARLGPRSRRQKSPSSPRSPPDKHTVHACASLTSACLLPRHRAALLCVDRAHSTTPRARHRRPSAFVLPTCSASSSVYA